MSQQQRAAPLSRHLTLSVYCRLWRLWPSGTGYFVMSALAIAVGSVVGQAVARCESIASQVQLIRVCSLAAFDLFALLANALSLPISLTMLSGTHYSTRSGQSMIIRHQCVKLVTGRAGSTENSTARAVPCLISTDPIICESAFFIVR